MYQRIVDDNVKLVLSVSNASDLLKCRNIVQQPHESDNDDLCTLHLEFLLLDLILVSAKKVKVGMQNHLKRINVFNQR